MGFSFVGKGSNRHFQCEIVKLDGSRRLLSMGTGWRPLDEFRGLFCVRGSGVRKKDDNGRNNILKNGSKVQADFCCKSWCLAIQWPIPSAAIAFHWRLGGLSICQGV